MTFCWGMGDRYPRATFSAPDHRLNRVSETHGVPESSGCAGLETSVKGPPELLNPQRGSYEIALPPKLRRLYRRG
jgi:hypothetical protein